MKKIYGVYHGMKEADSDCALYTENLTEALKEAEYISVHTGRDDFRRGYYVEVEVYTVEDDITPADFSERYPEPEIEEKVLEALGNHDTAFYFDFEALKKIEKEKEEN